MKKVTALLTVALIATLISGCGGNVPVKITNDLGAWDIEEIYIDPSVDEDWSNNLIHEILKPGDEITLKVSPGNYDIMAVDEDGDEYILWEVEIGSDGYNWRIEFADICH
ncbi:MAG: hypothetical protein KAR40_12965 [Candidatus Sabulitectum sp.]|nr:hypothetical protein [Candidatus Sabulitectum sp.]